MYNIFVSADSETWNGDPLILEEGRCVREYTDADLIKRFGDLTSDNVSELRRFPCIFAYEAFCKIDPQFGVIRDVVRRQKKVKVEYEIVKLDKFLKWAELEDLAFNLDIEEWELNRTHWAVKNINLAKELRAKNILLPHWARASGRAIDIAKHRFDVALSFPGEIRNYVEGVASTLESIIGPNAYFYDANYVSQLAQPSLDTLLQDIYLNRAKLVVVFYGKSYQDKDWCGIEFRAIKQILKQREYKRVMLVKMDDGSVEGIFETDGYVDGQMYKSDEVARFIYERLELLKETAKAN